MRLQLEPSERPLLTSRLGLASTATDTEIAAAVAARPTGSGAAPAGRSADPDAEAVIAAAVRDGKFAAGARADHYRERMARDPIGTRRLIARMQPNVVVVVVAAVQAQPLGLLVGQDRAGDRRRRKRQMPAASCRGAAHRRARGSIGTPAASGKDQAFRPLLDRWDSGRSPSRQRRRAQCRVSPRRDPGCLLIPRCWRGA